MRSFYMRKNPYKVLSVSQDACMLEIKRAYRKMMYEFHPDRNPGSTVAAEMSKMINEVYQLLSDPQERASYDYFARRQEVTREPIPEPVGPIDAVFQFLNEFGKFLQVSGRSISM